MAAKRKVIITCAVTGAIHTPSMSEHLPVTASEIAEAAIGAAEAQSRAGAGAERGTLGCGLTAAILPRIGPGPGRAARP